MANKSTTVKDAERKVSGAVVNVRNIEFPLDQYGFTTLLRKEGARAVGRIAGDEAKLDVFLHTLRCLGEHAKAKVEDQKKGREQAAAARANIVAADKARAEADQKREIERQEKVLEDMKANVAAQKGEVTEVVAADEKAAE